MAKKNFNWKTHILIFLGALYQKSASNKIFDVLPEFLTVVYLYNYKKGITPKTLKNG